MIKSINVEAENNELILKNENGDHVIIPANKRGWVKKRMAEGCHGCIDEFVKTLPVMSEYAGDGTTVPAFAQPAMGITDTFLKPIMAPPAGTVSIYDTPRAHQVDKVDYHKIDDYSAGKKREYATKNPVKDGMYANTMLDQLPASVGGSYSLENQDRDATGYAKEETAKYILSKFPYNSELGAEKYLSTLMPRERAQVEGSDIFDKTAKTYLDKLAQGGANVFETLAASGGGSPIYGAGMPTRDPEYRKVSDAYTDKEFKDAGLMDLTEGTFGMLAKPVQGVLNKLGVTDFKTVDGKDYDFTDALKGKQNDASIGWDIITDPTSWLGIGALAKGGSSVALKAASKHFGVDDLADGFNTATKAFKEAIEQGDTQTASAKLNQLIKAENEFQKLAEGTHAVDAVDVSYTNKGFTETEIKSLAEFGKQPAEANRMIKPDEFIDAKNRLASEVNFTQDPEYSGQFEEFGKFSENNSGMGIWNFSGDAPERIGNKTLEEAFDSKYVGKDAFRGMIANSMSPIQLKENKSVIDEIIGGLQTKYVNFLEKTQKKAYDAAILKGSSVIDALGAGENARNNVAQIVNQVYMVSNKVPTMINRSLPHNATAIKNATAAGGNMAAEWFKNPEVVGKVRELVKNDPKAQQIMDILEAKVLNPNRRAKVGSVFSDNALGYQAGTGQAREVSGVMGATKLSEAHRIYVDKFMEAPSIENLIQTIKGVAAHETTHDLMIQIDEVDGAISSIMDHAQGYLADKTGIYGINDALMARKDGLTSNPVYDNMSTAQLEYYANYLGTPDEVHARLMEIRVEAEIGQFSKKIGRVNQPKSNYNVTDEEAYKIVSKIYKGDSSVDRDFIIMLQRAAEASMPKASPGAINAKVVENMKSMLNTLPAIGILLALKEGMPAEDSVKNVPTN